MIDHLAQLQQQYESAVICHASIVASAFKTPSTALIGSLIESQASVDACAAELQKAIWLELMGEAA